MEAEGGPQYMGDAEWWSVENRIRLHRRWSISAGVDLQQQHLVAGSNASTNTNINMTDPTAAASYCFGIMLQLDVSVTGVLRVNMNTVNNLSRADEAQMNAVLTAATNAEDWTTASGWWSGTTPVACNQWLLRWPLSLNNIRIHNYDYIQLA